jgi:phenylalanyl-tRNA synthetase beta chain
MRPINNVVDITNYVMLETGQPLHAFDYDLVHGHELIARRADAGEKLLTLDGVERELDPDMLLICDSAGPLSVAGIMGGGSSEVTAETKRILLEVANFKRGSIRRTSGKLKLRTEASLRFEKGIGAGTPEYAQHRALHLFEQLTGGTVANGIADIYPGKQPPRTIELSAARIEQVLGIAIPEAEVMHILNVLGFECEVSDGDYRVLAPYWRPDVELPDDVIEDVARIYGYENLPATMLRGSLPEAEARPVEDLREQLRDLAVDAGFQEIITYTLTDMARLHRVVEPGDPERGEPLSVVNPVASQHTYLRTSLRAGMLETYAANRRHSEQALRLFEAGFEYLPVEADLPHERAVLCGLIGGPRANRWGRPSTEGLDFFDAKGALDVMIESLGVQASFAPTTGYGLLSGHSAVVRAGKVDVGLLAQVHPNTASQFDIDEPVFLLELWLEPLVTALPERPAYTPPSRFPEVRQDVALLVDEATPAARIVEIVRSHRSNTIRLSGEIFDEYRGPGVPEGKKSLAVSLRYQATDRTLTDDDVARVQAGLLKRLEKDLGASQRGV